MQWSLQSGSQKLIAFPSAFATVSDFVTVVVEACFLSVSPKVAFSFFVAHEQYTNRKKTEQVYLYVKSFALSSLTSDYCLSLLYIFVNVWTLRTFASEFFSSSPGKDLRKKLFTTFISKPQSLCNLKITLSICFVVKFATHSQ